MYLLVAGAAEGGLVGGAEEHRHRALAHIADRPHPSAASAVIAHPPSRLPSGHTHLAAFPSESHGLLHLLDLSPLCCGSGDRSATATVTG